MPIRPRRNTRRKAEQPASDGLITVKLSDLQAAALVQYYQLEIAAQMAEREQLLKHRVRQDKELQALQSHLDDLNGASHG